MSAPLSEVDHDPSAEHETGLPAVPQQDRRYAVHFREQPGCGVLRVRRDGVLLYSDWVRSEATGDDPGGSGEQDEPTNTTAAATAVAFHCGDDDLRVGLLARIVSDAD